MQRVQACDTQAEAEGKEDCISATAGEHNAACKWKGAVFDRARRWCELRNQEGNQEGRHGERKEEQEVNRAPKLQKINIKRNVSKNKCCALPSSALSSSSLGDGMASANQHNCAISWETIPIISRKI